KPQGPPTKAARHYEQAASRVTLDGTATERNLRAERRLAVAQRPDNQSLCFSPQGPLTREEVELIGEQFDTLAFVGLLPNKDVAPGATWKIAPAVAQALCQFEGLISQTLTGKREKVEDGSAIFSVTGEAQGIELGALAKLKITAEGRYDLLRHRMTK